MSDSSESTPTPQALQQLLTYCHVKSYPSKNTILSIGQHNNTLFYIQNGSVSVGTEDEDGHELIYAYLNAGQFIGEVGVFNNTELITVNIKTRTPCKLAEISYDRLKELLEHDLFDYASDILFLIGKQLADRLLMTSRHFYNLAFLDTEGRIAKALLELSEEPDAVQCSDSIQVKISRHELSRIVGCSREVAGRILKDLESKNIIRMKGKTISLLELQKLDC